MIKYLIKNKSGFTLTEVLVAVMVLVTAIVGSTNLLVSMMRSNSANAGTLQAYFYTQEGLEAFRNMRDTYFMNNVDYRGKGQNFFGIDGGFSGVGQYFVSTNVGAQTGITDSDNVVAAAPFKISKDEFDGGVVKFYKDASTPEETIFTRSCAVADYPFGGISTATVADSSAIKVTCTTSWEEHSNQREVSLSMILTNWKDD